MLSWTLHRSVKEILTVIKFSQVKLIDFFIAALTKLLMYFWVVPANRFPDTRSKVLSIDIGHGPKILTEIVFGVFRGRAIE